MLKYADFPFVSYQFHEFTDFTEEEQRTLEADWACVRDFIATLQRTFVDFRSQYPRLSSELRDSLLLLDTAPKWPHPPRFRFKRSFVTNIFEASCIVVTNDSRQRGVGWRPMNWLSIVTLFGVRHYGLLICVCCHSK